MMENTKCECGHNNPVGTALCEYCGKPLDEGGQKNRPLEMRYEGKARRSQTRTTSLVDRVWRFFSSVKVAVWLIVITLLLAVPGTFLPQENMVARPEVFYAQEYGAFGDLYYRLGLSNVYESPLFIALLSMIGISLVVCSLDRVIPLYKALKNQQTTKNIQFIQRQRVSCSQPMTEAEKSVMLDRLAEKLSRKRYRVSREGDSILAEKGRFSRWGPYINHIGLILFLLGVLLRFLVPGWYLDETVSIREGEVKKLPGVDYYLKNEQAKVEFYDQDEMPEGSEQSMVKEWKTEAVLYEKDPQTDKLQKVNEGSIVVNHPMKYGDLLLYQADFNTVTDAIVLDVKDKKTKETVGNFKVDLNNPQEKYRLDNGVEINILNYFPDFVMEGNQPTTKSENPNRPAFVFAVDSPKLDKPERSWLISGTDLDGIHQNNRYEIDLKNLETVHVSGLMVRIDKSLPIIFIGAGISVIGLAMGFFWYHRRVWLRWKEGTLYLGAHTNKNWFGLRRELEQVTEEADMPLQFTPQQK